MTELFWIDVNEDISNRACDMSGKNLVQLILYFDSVGVIDEKKLDSQMREFARDTVKMIVEQSNSEFDVMTNLSMLAYTIICTITAHLDFIEMKIEALKIEEGLGYGG
ncbi:MAG: hypothetical protein ACI36T_04575 [Eggerthellaceae bacterium]